LPDGKAALHLNNFIALIISFVLALAWLRINDFFAHRGWISSGLSRKIIHIGTGPIFVLTWLFFRDTPEARFLAALIPLAITAQFVLVGLGIWRDPAAVEAMSRTGDRREILRGPLYYGIAFVALTLIYWKDSPIGIIALMLLCGGDGLADVIGKRLGTVRLPWSKLKTWAGTIAMFFGGWLMGLIILGIYLAAGVFRGSLLDYLPGVTIIALAGTAVESLPLSDLDNLTVPGVAVALGHLLFRGMV
jgi:phytol kinase